MYVIASKLRGYALSRYGVGLGNYEYNTPRAARMALTRMRWSGKHEREFAPGSDDWEVYTYEEYRTQVVRKVTVKNRMSGKNVEITSDTSIGCDPSSETYWSM